MNRFSYDSRKISVSEILAKVAILESVLHTSMAINL